MKNDMLGGLNIGLDSWVDAKKGAFESAEVFSRPPLKSFQFLATTAVLVMLVVLDCGILVRLFNRISYWTDIYLLFVLAIALGTWVRTMVLHTRLHELYRQVVRENGSLESSIDLAMRAASSLSYWGSLSASAAGMAGLAALIQTVRSLR